MQAKRSSVEFPSTNFKFMAPRNGLGRTDGTSTSPDMVSALPSHTGETITKNNVSKGTAIKKTLRNTRPFVTRNVSLDNIAETTEAARRSPLYSTSKENIPLEPSPSPLAGALMLQRDAAATPIKRVSPSTFNTPPAAALWTRMISSPPTPLSPINRRRSTPAAGAGRCANLSQALELACAKARASDRPWGEAGVGGNPTQTTLPRPRTVSTQKRLREEIENEAPRKRITVTEQDQNTRPQQSVGMDGQYSNTRRVAAWRSSCATLHAANTSANLITSDEAATPEDSTMPSSPSSLAVERVSAELVTSPTGSVSLAIPDEGRLGLADLEVNAALVLASLFRA